MPKLLSTVSSLCQSGGLYTSTAGVSISTRVDIDESLQQKEKEKKKHFSINIPDEKKNYVKKGGTREQCGVCTAFVDEFLVSLFNS